MAPAAVPTWIGWRDHRTSVLLLSRRRRCRHCAPPCPESLCSRVVFVLHIIASNSTVSCAHISEHLASINTKVISVWVNWFIPALRLLSICFSIL
ncbi:hypothetical protein SORBI_3002G251050 [Sorghum bicolor]|uniref:Uncharacterized protein n=1 Tax=Sorghum bicolor TaxID=4558 RepID=A0A1W0W5Q8_SORBI|nr:hypothetical protein SORBI_3002G251050 [Sorghum bicolor]